MTALQTILGISAFFHDSAAALIVDGKIIAAAQEERFNREKNTACFPINAIRFCLQEANISLSEIDTVIYYEKPFLKFERLLETYYLNAPKGLFSFIRAMPAWVQKKLFVRREVRKSLQKIDSAFNKKKQLFFSSHHLSHAASAFYPSPFNKSAILIIDGVGEWSTVTIAQGEGSTIKLKKEMNFPDSIGLLYSSFTYFMGFQIDRGEYKLMGLAPYGNKSSEETKRFIHIIKNKLIKLFDDGSICINRSYFTYEHSLKMIDLKQWESLFEISYRIKGSPFLQCHCNLALAIQIVVEEIIFKMARYAKLITGCENICLAGGVALNCVVNGKLQDAGIFKNIWIQPAAGDAGCALGAALAFYHLEGKNNERQISETDDMNGGFLGPRILTASIKEFIKANAIQSKQYECKTNRDQYIVQEILKDKVIGIIQGRMEYGPRALGGRSIIANPSAKGMQRHLNTAIKKREDFRPFAPVMLREEAIKYYDCHHNADYMQFVRRLKPSYRYQLPKDYHQLGIKEKIETPRSKFQAVTHVDYSSRLQVIDNPMHPLYGLLMEMRKMTGDGMLINTSFNANGEPIVSAIEDAYTLFLNSNMDILVVEDHVFGK